VFTDNGTSMDMEAVGGIIQSADVLTIGFVGFPERLLIDTRHNQWDGPMVAIVAPVRTVQERYLWLGKHRGTFGPPEAFSFFVWPKSVRALAEEDVLGPMRRRLGAVSAESDAALDNLIGKLLELEQESWRAAIRGDDERWATVWQRPR
jgi:hypothetical protein